MAQRSWAGEGRDSSPQVDLSAAPITNAPQPPRSLDALRQRDGQTPAGTDPLAPAGEVDVAEGGELSAPSTPPETSPAMQEILRQYTGTSADLRRSGVVEEPKMLATRGWRKTMRTLTGGLLSPTATAAEIQETKDRQLAASEWSRMMSVVVANPKGGSSKTPTTICLAASFGDLRGGGVLAWDNNETLGTLGIRTLEGRFPTTVADLLANIEPLEQRESRRGDLGRFMRMQQDGKFEVLASDEDPGRMAVIGQPEFDRIHDVVGRFYTLVLIDTGNNPRAANFVAATARADQLVIPIQWAQDSVESAGRLIDQLHRSGRHDLVRQAVIVASNDGRGRAPGDQVARWREWFQRTCAGVYEIPFDPHIAERGPIRHSALAETTRTAYMHVAGGIASGLNNNDTWGTPV